MRSDIILHGILLITPLRQCMHAEIRSATSPRTPGCPTCNRRHCSLDTSADLRRVWALPTSETISSIWPPRRSSHPARFLIGTFCVPWRWRDPGMWRKSCRCRRSPRNCRSSWVLRKFGTPWAAFRDARPAASSRSATPRDREFRRHPRSSPLALIANAWSSGSVR